MAITLDITDVLQAAAFWVTIKVGWNGWKLFLYPPMRHVNGPRRSPWK